jgi:saccharopine dehydrogenase-like NADP-dependent oxidoreductase
MKLLILGVGAQGSTVAQRMDNEPRVTEIICADHDKKAVDELVKILKKAKGVRVDASDKSSIIEAAKGVNLIVNALPLKYAPVVMEAALAVKASYQDFAATDVLAKEWVDGINIMYNDYGKRFAENGTTAVIGTGSAPGLICVVARNAMRYLDSCHTINMLVYEGVEAKRFLPFWWSPFTALSDMMEVAFAFEDGEVIKTQSFSRPFYRKFRGVDGEVELVEHAHDEPVYIGLNSKEYFKGVKNAYFKYGGVGVDFARPLYRAGLLSKDPVTVKGKEVVPFDLVLKHVPPAPKYKEEIQEILDEGLVSDTGAMVVEAIGMKDGKKVMVETYVMSPGLVESFEKSGLTSEMYLTGQGGSLFTKMFVEDKYTQKGLISSDMLTYEQVDTYLKWAGQLGITLEVQVMPYQGA